jgi:hypothetical protein
VYEPPESRFPVTTYIPAELEGGTYAQTAVVWHTPYDFTLDFAALQTPEPSEPDDGEPEPVRPARVVARVRIPASFAFDLIRMIHQEMSRYEARWGDLRPPEPRAPEGR